MLKTAIDLLERDKDPEVTHYMSGDPTSCPIGVTYGINAQHWNELSTKDRMRLRSVGWTAWMYRDFLHWMDDRTRWQPYRPISWDTICAAWALRNPEKLPKTA